PRIPSNRPPTRRSSELIALAAVEALLAHPLLNSTWSDDGIILRRRIHLGIAVALPDGLLTPVVRDAQDLSLRGMARAVGDLARRDRKSTGLNSSHQISS